MNYAYFSTGLTNGELWQKTITQDFFDSEPENKLTITDYNDPISGETEDRRIKRDETDVQTHTTRFCDPKLLHPTLDKVIYFVTTEVAPYTDASYQSTYGFSVIDQTEAETEGFVFE